MKKALCTFRGNSQHCAVVEEHQAEPRKVSCGNAHTVVLVRAAEEEGTKLVGWGNNRYNALGMRKALGDRFSASKADQILGIHWPCTMRVFEEAESSQKKKPHSSRHFVEVACGNNHSVVLENLEPNSQFVLPGCYGAD
eukprot:s2999_g10.t1